MIADPQQSDRAQQLVGYLDVFRGESQAPMGFADDLLFSLILLRWLDHTDAELEAMATFEDRPYRRVLAHELQWRQLYKDQDPATRAARYKAVLRLAEDRTADESSPLAVYLQAAARTLARSLSVTLTYIEDLFRWVDAAPFETTADRRQLLELVDSTVDKMSTSQVELSWSPKSVTRLVVALARPRAGEKVYDPCFGSGEFLAALWQRTERDPSAARRPGALLEIAGIERNESAFLRGLVRQLLTGVHLPRLQLGDALERDAAACAIRDGFDIVVAEPPWGDRVGARASRDARSYQHYQFQTTDTVGLFVQHAVEQLKPQGRAVIVVPEGFLFRGGAERDLRRSLLESGQVEAVVGMPAGVYAPFSKVKCCLLVLSKQGGLDRVRMADATVLFDRSGSSKAAVIPGPMADQLAEQLLGPELRMSIKGVELDEPGGGRVTRATWEVSVRDLAASDWDLTPRRRTEGGLEALLGRLQLAVGKPGLVVPLSSVARVMSGRAIRSADLSDEPSSDRPVAYLRIKDIKQGKLGRATLWVKPGVVDEEHSAQTLAGDVVLSRSGTIGKIAVVRNGSVGAVAGGAFFVVRPDHERLDPSFLQVYLSSPACQRWLQARARGAAIQTLNRSVLDELPVPLPPLSIQARAAAQAQEFGTDVLEFLADATGERESERLTTFLARLAGAVPEFAQGLDTTPSLTSIEPLIEMARTARNWAAHSEISGQALRWLNPLSEALLPLKGVSQIPAGPSLLSVLQEAERGLQIAAERARGNMPTELQARAVAERLADWMRSAISDLVDHSSVDVRAAAVELVVGSLAEFSVEVVNQGSLPLRTFHVETTPDWGQLTAPFLAERGSIMLTLKGDAPKVPGQMVLQVNWSAKNLVGGEAKGSVELPLKVSDPRVASVSQANLGGNPYVVGSALEPGHGDAVFYGRRDLIEQISRQIMTHGNVVLLEGNRRAGKTSILRHLEGRTAVPGWLAVYASLQGAEGDSSNRLGVPTADVFRVMSVEIAKSLVRLNIETPLPNGSTIAAGKPALGIARACRDGISDVAPFSDFREYLEVVLETLRPLGLNLLLMLDEFDKLQEGIDNKITSPQVPENIRFVIQGYPRFSAILTGSRRLKRLREEYWSALYGLGTSISVTALDVDSARRVVTEPVRDRLLFSDEAVDRVLDLSARQPYLMQCICNRIFEYAVQSTARSITLSIVNTVANLLVRDNEHFASLWKYAGEGPKAGKLRRQLLLMLCARSFKEGSPFSLAILKEQLSQAGAPANDEDLDTDLAYLRELELIDLVGQIGDGQYKLSVPLMGDWIEQHQDAELVKSRAHAEWVDETHAEEEEEEDDDDRPAVSDPGN